MKVAGNEVRPGMVIELNGALWTVVKAEATKTGKSGAYAQLELKNILTGVKLNERFRAAEALEAVELETRDFQFLYASGEILTFMDLETFDQLEMAADFLGERAAYLQDGMKTVMAMHDGRPISVRLPQQVTLAIAETEPVMKGQTAAPSYKSAVLENGIRTQVPPFVDVGTRIVVSTEDGAYVRRAE
jgi:elongation factor P